MNQHLPGGSQVPVRKSPHAITFNSLLPHKFKSEEGGSNVLLPPLRSGDHESKSCLPIEVKNDADI